MCILTKHVCYSFGSSSQPFIFALLLSSWDNKSASTNPSSCYHGWAYDVVRYTRRDSSHPCEPCRLFAVHRDFRIFMVHLPYLLFLLRPDWYPYQAASGVASITVCQVVYAIAFQILRIMGCVVSYPGHRVLCKPAPSHTAYGLARLGHWRARDDRWQPHRLFRSSRTTCFLYPQKEFDIGAAPDRNVSLDVEDYFSMSAEKEVEAGASTTLRPHITARSM